MPTHRLLADEQLPARVTKRLRLLGHNVLTLQQCNVSKYGDGKSDDWVLRIAAADERAVVTLNRKHFLALHYQNEGHFGIIACFRDDSDPDALGRRIDDQIRPIGHLNGQYVEVPKPTAPSKRRKNRRREQK